MRRLGLILGLLLVLAGRCEAQSGNGVPHSGIGPCPAGQVVSRLNANAPPTCVATSGTGTVVSVSGANGLTTTNSTTTPQLTIPNNTWYAVGFTGATVDVQINACLTAAAATNGTCDSTGITGNQSPVALITVPPGVTWLVGAAKYAESTYSPMIQIGTKSQIIGQKNSIAISEFDCTLSGCSNIVGNTPPTTTANARIVSLVLRGPNSSSDGSIAIDITNFLESYIGYNVIAGVNTGIKLGGNGTGAFYNKFDTNIFGGIVGIGIDYGQNANKNTSTHDIMSITSGTTGWNFASSNTSNEILDADCEPSSITNCVDIAGSGVTIVDGYFEGGYTNSVKLEPTAAKNMILGTALGAKFTYGTADQISNFQLSLNGNGSGGQLVWPTYFDSANYMLPSGSAAQYFDLMDDNQASGQLGTGMLFIPGGVAETQSNLGYTGHAGFRAGWLESTGGLGVSGKTTTTAISPPGTPTCTATCSGACATAYQYAVVCTDFSGGKTTATGTAHCNNNASLDSSDYNIVNWAKQDGCRLWDIIGNQDLVHSVATSANVPIPGTPASPGTVYAYKDTNNSPAPYAAPTRNGTGDLNVVGLLTEGCAGQQALSSASPSTATVTNACITGSTNVIECTDCSGTGAPSGAIRCVPSAGSLAITGPNTITDVICWSRLQ